MNEIIINILATIGGIFLYSLMFFVTYKLIARDIKNEGEVIDSDEIFLSVLLCLIWFIALPFILLCYLIKFFINLHNLFKLEEKVNNLETELKKLKRKR